MKKKKNNKYYIDEVWIDGIYNLDYPPYLVIKRRVFHIFYKTIIDFGLLVTIEDCKEKYKIANRYLHLLNIRYNYKQVKN